jgi:hypothetical protein
VVPNPYMLLGLISDEAKFFPCLDIKDAFFYILLAPESQLIFAFQWEKSQDFFFFFGRKRAINVDSIATRFQKFTHYFWN